MKETIKAALSVAEADYCEIRIEETHLTSIAFRGPKLDRLSQNIQFGGNVRALVDGGWGFVSFTNLDDLEAKVKAACSQAKAIATLQKGESLLAPVPVVEQEVVTEAINDPRQVTLEEKLKLLSGYNEIILDYHPSITSSVIVYFDKGIKTYFGNSEGTYITQDRVDLGCNMRAIATRGDITVQEGISAGTNNDFGCMLNLEDELRTACQLTINLLDAPTVKGGEYTVILDPEMAGLFAHEAFGHLSEADDISENPELRKVMVLGKRFGRDILSIYDIGPLQGQRGTVIYDDEGVATEKTYLIKEGILIGRLHSRETAGKMGEKPTGSARAMDYRFPPLVRMRTTCIEQGESSFEDMLKDIKLGLYVLGGYGGETGGEMFTFTAGHGYMIRDGKLAELVKDITLTGNVFTTLANIDMVGNDYAYVNNAGGCGKWSQGPLATSEGSPHIRVQKVIVGGAK